MPELVPATDSHLSQILSETFPLWGDGLTPRRYAAWNRAQSRTSWGQAHLQRVAWIEGDALLASAKRYAIKTWLDGRAVDTLGIGAVFTPPPRRGRGHAAALIEAMCREAAAGGCELALLFSEIGARYYERLGFRVVPVTSCDIVVRVQGGAPAMLVRAGEERDAAAVAATHVRRVSRYRFGLVPDGDLVAYSVTKKRLMAGFDSSRRRSVEYFVAEEGSQAVAYALIQISRPSRPGEPDTWSLAACGDRDPAGARLGALLQVLLARAPGAQPPRIRSWWPGNLHPPQLEIRPRGQAAEIMMCRPLTAAAEPRPSLESHDVLYWHGDAF